MVLPSLECIKCGHKWIPRRAEPPAVCPKCGNSRWQARHTPTSNDGGDGDNSKGRVIFRANRTLGAYDNGGIEELMRFVLDCMPTFSEDEERLIRRICESFSLNLEITIRGEVHAEQNEQEDNSNRPQEDDVAGKVAAAQRIARGDLAGKGDPNRFRKKAR